MLKILSGSDTSKHPALMDRVYRFRHKILIKGRGWDGPRQPDDLERDPFEEAHTIHHVRLLGDKTVGYQRPRPTRRPHLLIHVLDDLCRRLQPRGPQDFELKRFCIVQGRREMHPRRDSPFLELAQGVVEWGMANRVDTVTVAIDWRLMVIAMQLRFFVRPLGFPPRIGGDEVVALRMSFNHETLSARHAARGCTNSVLTDATWPTAA